ncbi:MAG: N-acetylmuramoyl-L-alanine amidase [Planctomycetes bacterium]|nr:N-acetylmuramoyl-L-alanine amidase [Planctomycetota bacterium]
MTPQRKEAPIGRRRHARRLCLGALAAVAGFLVSSHAPPAPGQASSPKPAVDWSRALWRTSGGNRTITHIVIHTVEGSAPGAIAWFKNALSFVSAHYVVAKSGHITQMVNDHDGAWHAGNSYFNHHSIGIEHEGYADRPGSIVLAEYQASAALTRWLCDTYGIPKDRQHIVGHVEVPGATHHDPGRAWDWDLYMRLVRGNPNSRPTSKFFVDDQGGQVRMTLVLTNPTEYPMSLKFTRWPAFDFVIVNDRGSEVWRWNRNRRFADSPPPERVLNAKQSMYFSVLARYGRNVPPGRYQARGAAMTSPLLFGSQWFDLDPGTVDYSRPPVDFGRSETEVGILGPGVAPGDPSTAGLIERIGTFEGDGE